MNLNPIDILISLILMYYIFSGFRSGFIKQFVQIISIITGYTFANIFYPIGYEKLAPYINSPIILNITSYILIFLIVVFLIQLILNIINLLFKITASGWINRLLGILLGTLKGLFITSLIIFILESFPETIELRKKMKNESILYSICDSLKKWTIKTLTEEELMYKIQQDIIEKTEEKYIQKILDKTKN